MLPYTTFSFELNDQQILIAVPDKEALKEWYELNKSTQSFPYWAKVWPAAKALSKFITEHTLLLANKKVVEIAGGLGLPSLFAAASAKEVLCTDAFEHAITFINKSIELNSFTNITTALFNWNNDTSTIDADIILMSDVNYDPSEFDALLAFIEKLLQKETIILLSTPQRLMAKPFIEALIPFTAQQEETEIDESICSVFVLKKQF